MQARTLAIHGENISYLDAGHGDVTLLFLHGAFIFKEYWTAQIAHFAKSHRVVAVDLAGHGASTHQRTDLTISDYGSDVTGLIRELGLRNVILIGHSFGADVMLEAVTHDAANIIGLLELDHLKNVGSAPPPAFIEQLIAGFRADFAATCAQFARGALVSDATDPALVDRLLADYTKMNQEVGISLFQRTLDYPSREVALLEGLSQKLYSIHVNYAPTNAEALRQCLGGNYSLRTIDGTCHYPMLEHPGLLNLVLEEVVAEIRAV